jgi:hypothetical protein
VRDREGGERSGRMTVADIDALLYKALILSSSSSARFASRDEPGWKQS